MNKLILSIYFLIITQVILPQSNIVFFDGPFEEALTKAKQEQKMIFIDIYADWCGPCKKMAKEVFTNRDVAEFYNNSFISLNINPEKETEHPFVKDRNITAFPSFYWLSSEGDIQLYAEGFLSTEEIIAKGKESKNSFVMEDYKKYHSLWISNKRTPENVRELIKTLRVVAPEKVSTTLKEYIEGLSDTELKKVDNYPFILELAQYEQRSPGKALRILVENEEVFKELEASGIYENNLYRLIVRTASALNTIPPKGVDFVNQVDSIFGKRSIIYQDLIEVEKMLFEKQYQRGIEKAISLAEENNSYWIYSEILYTLIISEYFLADIDSSLNEIVINIAGKALHDYPSKATIMYLAIAYAHQNDYAKSYELLASQNLYPSPVLSNAIYKLINLEVIRPE